MNELILYTTEDGRSQTKLRADLGTVWLTQLDMAELFDATKQNISLHLKNIFQDGELGPAATVKESLTTAVDGKRYRQRSILYTLCRESPPPICVRNSQGMLDGSNAKTITGKRRPGLRFATRRVANFFVTALAANTDKSSVTQGRQRGKS